MLRQVLSHVFNIAASVVLLERGYRLQALHDLQSTAGAARVQALLLRRYVTRGSGRPIAELEALKQSNLANKMGNIATSCVAFSFKLQ